MATTSPWRFNPTTTAFPDHNTLTANVPSPISQLLPRSIQPPQPPPSSPPTTFPLFTLLPAELRLKIWSLALPPPRLIPLHYHSLTLTPSSTIPYTTLSSTTTLLGTTSPAPLPPTLHTCIESRLHALNYYALHLNPAYLPPKIYFRPTHDILYFGPRRGYMASFKHFINATSVIEGRELAGVRRLGVSAGLFRGKAGVMRSTLREFWAVVRGKFTGVREVWIIDEGEEDSEGGDDIPDAAGCDGHANTEQAWSWEVEGRVRGERQGSFKAGRKWDDGCRDKDGRPERFYWEVIRAVAYVEERWGWEAPAWRVLRVPKEREDEKAEEELVVVEDVLVEDVIVDDVLVEDAEMLDCADNGLIMEFTSDASSVKEEYWEWEI